MGIIIVYPWTAGRSTSQPERKSILNIIGKTDAETETLILWSPNAKNWFIGKDPDAGKDWRQEEKGMTEDDMVGWHHQLDGHQFEHGTWLWTGKPGVLQSMGSQRFWHDWVTDLNGTEAWESGGNGSWEVLQPTIKVCIYFTEWEEGYCPYEAPHFCVKNVGGNEDQKLRTARERLWKAVSFVLQFTTMIAHVFVCFGQWDVWDLSSPRGHVTCASCSGSFQM